MCMDLRCHMNCSTFNCVKLKRIACKMSCKMNHSNHYCMHVPYVFTFTLCVVYASYKQMLMVHSWLIVFEANRESANLNVHGVCCGVAG